MLKRDMENKMIAGVCAGIAKETEIDPMLIRVLFILSILLGFGLGFVIYALMWILMPKA